MKKYIALALAALLALGLLAGCGNAKGPDIAASAGTGPATLDPQLASSQEERTYIAHLFEPLVVFNGAGGETIEPAAAKSWSVQTQEADGAALEVYTFVMRQSGWSDGKAVTADNFVFAIERLLRSPQAHHLAPYIQGGEAYRAGEIGPEALGAAAADDQTLVITLEKPCPGFLELMAGLYPVRRDIQEADANWAMTAATLVSNGPYVMQSWGADALVMTKNTKYWNTLSVRAETITWKFIGDGDAALAAVRAGDILLAQAYPFAQAEALRLEGLLRQTAAWGGYGAIFQTNAAPFEDARVREAFFTALSLYGGGESTAQVKALLAEAGYPSGRSLPPIELIYAPSTMNDASVLTLQSAWQDVLNIEVTLTPKTQAELDAAVRAGDFQIACVDMNPLCADPTAFYVPLTTPYNAFFSDADFDALVKEALSAQGAQREERALAAQAALNAEFVVLPVYNNTLSALCAPDLQGLRRDPSGIAHLEMAYKP